VNVVHGCNLPVATSRAETYTHEAVVRFTIHYGPRFAAWCIIEFLEHHPALYRPRGGGRSKQHRKILDQLNALFLH
jgi:hypothetical protein